MKNGSHICITFISHRNHLNLKKILYYFGLMVDQVVLHYLVLCMNMVHLYAMMHLVLWWIILNLGIKELILFISNHLHKLDFLILIWKRMKTIQLGMIKLLLILIFMLFYNFSKSSLNLKLYLLTYQVKAMQVSMSQPLLISKIYIKNRVHQHITKNPGAINFQGFAVGNGCTEL